jgi:branched-chain amino acid transport system substrate-binding protein
MSQVWFSTNYGSAGTGAVAGIERVDGDREMHALKKGTQRLVIGAATASVVLAAAACSSSGSSSGGGSSSSGQTKVAKVTIGEVTDLSGAASFYGIPENHGGEIAADQVNAAGGIKSLGGAKLAIKTYDTASNTDNGQTQATAAVGDKVSAVFGGEISDTVLAGINVTQRAGVPWVDSGGTANGIHQRGYTTVFQADHDSTQFASDWLAVAQQAAQKLGISNPTVAISYSQTSYGEELLAAWNTAATAAGLKTATSFGYPLTTTDFSSIAARSVASNADIILNLGYPGDGLALAKLFATQSKPKQKIVIMAGSDASAVTGQLATQANGVLIGGDITPSVKGLPASFTTFYNAYEAKYKTAPNSQALAGYISVRFIAAALDKAGSDSPSAVTKALHEVTLTHSTGNIYPEPATLSFASNGVLNNAPFYAAQITGGAGKLVYPASVAETTIGAYNGG